MTRLNSPIWDKLSQIATCSFHIRTPLENGVQYSSYGNDTSAEPGRNYCVQQKCITQTLLITKVGTTHLLRPWHQNQLQIDTNHTSVVHLWTGLLANQQFHRLLVRHLGTEWPAQLP